MIISLVQAFLILCSHLNASQPQSFFSVLGDPFDNGYSEERYHHVLDTLAEVYEPLIAERGGFLIVDRDWSDGAVNMWAERWGQEYRLEVPGGMARYYLIHEEAFITSLCHELGHLLGGAPDHNQISFEGQSDYSASRDCLPRLLRKIDPQVAKLPDTDVLTWCTEQQSGESDRELCQRSLQGAKSLTALYAELEGSGFPKINTPSAQMVSETLKSHPPAQCRLDTFVAGFAGKERPRCWYRPLTADQP